ncbi:MAG: hypothetical protein H7834_15390 [Magnetococcus sp. YQC-9]
MTTSRGVTGLGEVILYQTEDGRTRLQVVLQNETVWLTLNQIALLFDRDNSVISRHIRNIFSDGELRVEQVVAQNATTAADGQRLREYASVPHPSAALWQIAFHLQNLVAKMTILVYIKINNTRQGYARSSTLKPAGFLFGESGSGSLSHAL